MFRRIHWKRGGSTVVSGASDMRGGLGSGEDER